MLDQLIETMKARGITEITVKLAPDAFNKESSTVTESEESTDEELAVESVPESELGIESIDSSIFTATRKSSKSKNTDDAGSSIFTGNLKLRKKPNFDKLTTFQLNAGYKAFRKYHVAKLNRTLEKGVTLQTVVDELNSSLGTDKSRAAWTTSLRDYERDYFSTDNLETRNNTQEDTQENTDA